MKSVHASKFPGLKPMPVTLEKTVIIDGFRHASGNRSPLKIVSADTSKENLAAIGRYVIQVERGELPGPVLSRRTP